MPSFARQSRAYSQHGRHRKRVRALADEVASLQAPIALHPVEASSQDIKQSADAVLGLESLLEKALVLTRGWERIASLVALITTNLSGNKTLGPLLEILAKDKAASASSAIANNQSSSQLSISDLLSMAESILKTGQLPSGIIPQTQTSPDENEPIAIVDSTDLIPNDSLDNANPSATVDVDYQTSVDVTPDAPISPDESAKREESIKASEPDEVSVEEAEVSYVV